MNVIDVLMGWAQASNRMLLDRGVEVSFGRSNDSRPKASGYLNLRRGGSEADLVLWDTGEAELALVAAGSAPVQTHEDIDALDKLSELVARMLAMFPPADDP